MEKEWFKDWFSSPYYHVLYGSRDETEAQNFINNLCDLLQPKQNAKVLDVACGKGRHAIYLNKKGFDVVGIDISYPSIKYAKQFENEKLKFFIHDMRQLLYTNYFDLVVNLFTSFGYFENKYQHIKALKCFARGLNKDGIFVIDYLNSKKVKSKLVAFETKNAGGIDFNIHRKIENQKILKQIEFTVNGKLFNFQEKVADFEIADFREMLHLSNFEIVEVFGDYHLNPFHEQDSDRLILLCKIKE